MREIPLPVGWKGGALGLSGHRLLLATGQALSRAAGGMDEESLLLSLELASGSGQGLSPDRRASLLTSLMLVKRDYRFDRSSPCLLVSLTRLPQTPLKGSCLSSPVALPRLYHSCYHSC